MCVLVGTPGCVGRVGWPSKIFNPPPQFSRLGIQVSGVCLFVCLFACLFDCLICGCFTMFRMWVGVSFVLLFLNILI